MGFNSAPSPAFTRRPQRFPAPPTSRAARPACVAVSGLRRSTSGAPGETGEMGYWFGTQDYLKTRGAKQPFFAPLKLAETGWFVCLFPLLIWECSMFKRVCLFYDSTLVGPLLERGHTGESLRLGMVVRHIDGTVKIGCFYRIHTKWFPLAQLPVCFRL